MDPYDIPDYLIQIDPFALENWVMFVFVDLASRWNYVVKTGENICYLFTW